MRSAETDVIFGAIHLCVGMHELNKSSLITITNTRYQNILKLKKD
jgi:GTP cyclohydrolase I